MGAAVLVKIGPDGVLFFEGFEGEGRISFFGSSLPELNHVGGLESRGTVIRHKNTSSLDRQPAKRFNLEYNN